MAGFRITVGQVRTVQHRHAPRPATTCLTGSVIESLAADLGSTQYSAAHNNHVFRSGRVQPAGVDGKAPAYMPGYAGADGYAAGTGADGYAAGARCCCCCCCWNPRGLAAPGSGLPVASDANGLLPPMPPGPQPGVKGLCGLSLPLPGLADRPSGPRSAAGDPTRPVTG
jgi:hypothetical protein